MIDPKAFNYLDKEEKELMESVERGEWKVVPMTAKERKDFQKSAAFTLKMLKKNKPISLRLPSRDVEEIKRKANQKGLPYQTLIASILHQYVTGKIIVTL